MELGGQLHVPPTLSPGTHWIGGWMGPRAGLDDMENRKFLILSGLKLRPLSRPARGHSLHRLRYPSSFIFIIKGPKIRRHLFSKRKITRPIFWLIQYVHIVNVYIQRKMARSYVCARSEVSRSRYEDHHVLRCEVVLSGSWFQSPTASHHGRQ
jgi:hypothetical protein